jgi:hypothetical protein
VIRFYVTYVCAECGWSFGPGRKKTVKQMAAFHRYVHKLEKDVNMRGKES